MRKEVCERGIAAVTVRGAVSGAAMRCEQTAVAQCRGRARGGVHSAVSGDSLGTPRSDTRLTSCFPTSSRQRPFNVRGTPLTTEVRLRPPGAAESPHPCRLLVRQCRTSSKPPPSRLPQPSITAPPHTVKHPLLRLLCCSSPHPAFHSHLPAPRALPPHPAMPHTPPRTSPTSITFSPRMTTAAPAGTSA